MALPLVWLGDVLRAAGLTVVEAPGWQERTANSGAQPEPVGVLQHHTATVASYEDPAPSLQLVIDGRSDLAGPLCHGLIGFDGVVHLISAGRANHAGRAQASGPVPAGDGNVLYVGFEWDYQGVEQGPSPEQYTAALVATKAVLDHLGAPYEASRGHKETSVTGKIDPGHVDLDRFRAELATNEQENADMTPEQDAILRRIENELLGPRGPEGQIAGWNTALGPRTPVAMLVDLVNGLLATQTPAPMQAPAVPQQQTASGEAPAPAQPADPESIKAAFSALPPEQAAPLLAELVQIQQDRQLTPEQQARTTA
ncbi:N-acetylmuramoyl-L-alanine amidase [Saccharopolyspora sp. NFXS83]|uniref:peptidoglycan recognition protein family protein n=1 Tax=Saccharopolyspora sp. NFXS83 TaxID=2993560 RepID=UPI00224ADE41|nr:N-acetylmuramoyl-L-alanine amidase [Saccharopolyspora sp. NFXS83]MCX2731551.1 N-acetylmuramoyl-L-alanine amidase [Saccharopolyspora sp. NFXS83]